MTKAELEAIVTGIAGPLGERFDKQQDEIRLLQNQVSMLQAECATLRTKSFAFRGPWRDNKTYTKGDFVQRSGSLWLATVNEPSGTPGDNNSGWLLVVKRGVLLDDDHVAA
jgi:hypothetical protein